MVLVGATIVGSMATVWHGVVNSRRTGTPTEWRYTDKEIAFEQGEEMGRFLLGSTIVMLFQEATITFNESWIPARQVKLGESMGNRLI
jgi:phosphatidylserine decarboxylase